MTGKPKQLRCALYTRKSSDEGLDQEFNSLDAQREACAAYVKSQAQEGWKAMATHYDDGGFSGGSMERPALKKLLADIAAGKIDVIVVYKIDRLTRSLADFARMVELFDKHEVSFVSVTQSFNTTTSMGRLTLNVLLSFAQFEREVTGERIRDKIAASKAKGMWMGGMLPLGYDPPQDKSRTLVVNESEAATVLLIFSKYLELGSVHELVRWLAREQIHSKRWTSSTGRIMGGLTFSRGALYHLLRNPVYRGLIRHKDICHPGGHAPIVSEELFAKVQAALGAGARRTKARRDPARRGSLTGRIFDAAGEPMSPTSATGKQGRSYRYYVSASLQCGKKTGDQAPGSKDSAIIRRIAARTIEERITELVARLVPEQAATALDSPSRIEIHRGAVHLTLPRAISCGLQARLAEDETIEEDHSDSSCLRVIAPVRIYNLRGKTEIRTSTTPSRKRDPFLIGALRRAHAMIERDSRHQPICRTSPATQYGRRLIRLAFLAPDLQKAILDGTQPADLTLEELITKPIPVDWNAQRKLFA